MEAQRYPEDFDAIIAGAPVYNQVHLNESQVSLQVEMLKDPARLVPATKVTLFNDAVLAACDEKDGVKDGIVSDPRTCKFDPATLLCKGGDGAGCFTSAQVDSAKKAYAPVTTKSGELVYPGHSPGFEFGWRIPTTAAAMNPLFADMPRYLGRQDTNFDLMSFDLDTDLALALKNGAIIESSDPNLAKFKARGGKLLMYHGWADPGPAPENTINYYNAVTKALGDAKQDDWMRLFLMPGMGHCSWRSRAGPGGFPWCHGSLEGKGRHAESDRRGAQWRRKRRTDSNDASAVSVSSACEVFRHGQHR